MIHDFNYNRAFVIDKINSVRVSAMKDIKIFPLVKIAFQILVKTRMKDDILLSLEIDDI